MKPERRPFMPLSIAVDDAKLEALAREKGVGRFETPAALPAGAGEGAAPPVPSASGATPRSKMKKVNFELPDYVWTELKIRAAHKQTSVRHVIMEALQADSFTIKVIDMIEDGRRFRGSNKPLGF